MSGSDDLGGLGDLDDADGDLGGLDEEGFDEGGESLGGLDEGEFDDMGGSEEMAASGNLDELEHRLDELENEVGSLSSTVNTVRNENEQISESVEEVEENVRKLLDIYEMVTRGVNPFADEVDPGMGGMGGEMEDSSFGLFTDEEDDQNTEGVDEDITEADAEGFFDDDIVEEEENDFDDGSESFDSEEMPDDESAETASTEADETLDDEAEMFDDEVEMFDDDLAETEDGSAGAVDESQGQAEESTDPVDDSAQRGEPPETESADTAEDDLLDQVVEESDQRHADGPSQAAVSPDAVTTAADTAGRPYLVTVPDGLGPELVVVEWLEFLVDEVGRREASRAIEYYESIDWLTGDVADRLATYLQEFDFPSPGNGSLGAGIHLRSLAFIEQLNGGDAETADSSSVGVFGP